MCSFFFFFFFFFFFNDTATTEIYTLSLHGRSSDLVLGVRLVRPRQLARRAELGARGDPARSEEHTSELQSRSDLVCRLLLEKKKKKVYEVPLSKKNKIN